MKDYPTLDPPAWWELCLPVLVPLLLLAAGAGVVVRLVRDVVKRRCE